MFGLLYDAGEAYLGDIPRPLKAERQIFERLESDILEAIWSSFDIDPPTEDEWNRIMAADDRLLTYEATHLLEGGDCAEDPPDRTYDLNSGNIEQIREEFRSRAESLLNQT